jgi:hypothetical protein
MKTFSATIMFLTLLFTACFSHAQDKFDPAARAKAIAPYIDEQTFAIIHIDVAHVKIDSLMDVSSRLLPEDKEDVLQSKAVLQQMKDSYVNAGGKDIYVGLRMHRQDSAFVVFLLGDKFDQQAIEKNPIFEPIFRRLALKRIGNIALGAIDMQQGLARLEKMTPDPRPELATALEAAGDTAVQIILLPPKHFKRVFEETMPQLPQEIGGGPSSVITKGCLWAALGMDLSPRLSARLVVQSQDAAAAAGLADLCSKLLENFAKQPVVQKVVPNFSQSIADLTPKPQADRLVLVIDDQKKEISNLIGNVQTVALADLKDSAWRSQSMNNLKQIGLAMHNYHDENKHFPAAASYSPDGKPLLSWRVMLLPMMEYGNLYDQFHFNEPWDSPNNRKLIDKMPPEFRSPKSKLKEPGRTNYVLPIGPGTVFEGREGPPIKSITDGTAHTIMAVEVDDAHAVIWTKPDDLPYDPKEPAKGLGRLYKNVFLALFCDGSVRVIELPYPDDQLRAAFSANAGDPAPQF